MSSIKNIITIVGSIIVIVLGIVAWQYVRGLRRDANTAAKTQTAVYVPKVAESKDSVKIHEPGVATADTNFTRVLTRPKVPPPKVHTGGDIKKDSASKDTTQYVTLQSYNVLKQRLDSTTLEGEKYRDTTRLQLLRYPRLVAFQDSVTKYQGIQIKTGRPRRSWALGVSVGPGAAYVSTDKVVIGQDGKPVVNKVKEVKFTTITANIGLTFSF